MSAKTRRLFYGISTMVTGLVVVLVSSNLISHDMENNVNGIITALLGIFGTGATATAAIHTNRQIKKGSLDPALADSPPPPAYNPADAVIGGLNDLNNMHVQVQEGLGRIQEAAASVGIPLPVYPQQGQPQPTAAPIPISDLVQRTIDASQQP